MASLLDRTDPPSSGICLLIAPTPPLFRPGARMEIAEIAPLLRADKITVTISAEKNEKLRVTYPG